MKNPFIRPLCTELPVHRKSVKPITALAKKPACLILLTGIFICLAINSYSQATGDYRSNAATMNWNAAASWQKYNGAAWVVSTDYPGQNACTGCTVTIQNSNTVTLNVTPANSVGNIVVGGGTSGVLTLGTFALVDAGNLTVSAGATINLATGTFTVAGTSSIAGTVSDASNTGVNTFTGLVTKTAGTWTSTAVTTTANMVFTNGFTNTAGTFTAGAATVGAGATLLATNAMAFNSTFSCLGALTVDGAGGVAFGNNATIAGNLSIAANSSLTFNGLATTLNITTAGNLSIATGATLSIAATGNIAIVGTTSINGTFIDNSDTGTDTFTGLVTNNGIFNTDIVTTAGNVRINGGFTNATGATCSLTSVRLAGGITGTTAITIDGAVTTNGTVTIAGGTVYITGTSNAVFASALVTSSGATLGVSTTGLLSVAGATTNAGTFVDNDNTSTTTFTGLFTNSGSVDFSALSTANIIFNGGITNTAGTFNVPTATISTAYTGNDINATSSINFSGGVTFTGASTLAIAGAGGVTFSGSASILIPAAMTMATGSAVTVSTTGNFTVTGTTTMSGSFTDNENTGVTTFTGLVTKNSTGVWTSTAVTTSANMVFTAGITQTGGSFNSGGASFPNGITLTSNPVMTFNNPISIGGLGNITFAGTGGIVLAGAGINYTIPGNLTLTGLLTVSTTGNFTVNGTTTMTGTGGFTDNNNTGISTFTGLVTHNSTGRWTTTAVTTPSNLILSAGFTNTAGTFSAGGATIGDNKTLTGTINMSFVNGVTVLGNADITIAGTATTGVTFGGTLIDYSIRNLTLSGRVTTSTTGNLTVSGTTTISSTGNFLDNNNAGVTTFTGLVTVGSTATFTTTSVNIIGRLIFAGGITQNNTTTGAFSAGTIRTSATQTWSGAGNISTTGVLDVNAGTLTNNITGTITVAGTLTGVGTTWVQGTNAKLSLNSTTPLTIATLTSTATGNTVTYGAAGNATMRSQTYFNLTVAGSGNKIIPTADITVNGTLTITAGVLSNTTNNKNIILGGSWMNNVGPTGFTAGTGTVTFSGTAAQTLGGTGITNFKNLTVNNSTGINQTINVVITGVLTLTTGKITTGTNVVSISSTGNVVRTSGYIVGNEQRNFAVGAAVAKTFDIGDATNYTPLTLTFASISTAGDVTVKTSTGDHPSIGVSMLNSSLSINRYWTLTNSATVFTNYAAVCNFVAGDKDASINTANVVAGNYNASSWIYPTVGTKTTTSTQVNSLTTFGDIAIAEALPCSTPMLIITNPAGVCSPATANLTAAAVTAGSTSGLTYTYWNDAGATSSLSTPTAVTTGTYYIKGTVPLGGCADIKPVTVTKANPTGVLSGTATVCTGQSSAVSIAVTGTGPWAGTLSDGTTFSGSSNPLTAFVTPAITSTYTIATLVDANSCGAQAVDKTGSATITLAPLPTTADAGPDQSACGSSVILAANTATVGAGAWSIVSGTGGSFTDIASPTSTFSGTAGVTYVLRWSISNSTCTPSTDDVSITFTSGTWIGTADTDWNNTANWCGGLVPTGSIDLNLPAGLANYPEIADNIIVNNLSIASGASITVSGTLTITGTYSNSGSIANTGSVVLNGAVSQSFPGASATITAMKNLEVDNDAGVVIDKSFSITGTLSSTNGVIDLADKIITLQSDATGTASVSYVGGSFAYSGGGKFIVQRYVPARRAWRLLTAPVTNAGSIYDAWQNSGVYTPGAGTLVSGPGGGNGLDTAASSSLKTWDVPSQALVAVTNTNNSISSGSSGSADNTGYFGFIRGDRNPANYLASNSNATTLSCSGELQTGAQTFNAASTAAKFTLIGNPYASAIDFNTVTRTNLVKRFYAWDPTLNTVGGYVTLDDIDGDGIFSKSVAGSSQTRIITSQQAFFVETAATAAASLTINESDKYDGASLVGSRPTAVNESLSADLYLLNTDNSTVLADGVKAEFDDGFSSLVNYEDAIKFGNANENFAWVRNGNALTIERRPTIRLTDTLFLKLTKTTARSYQYKFTANNMDYHGLTAILKDSYLGTSSTVNLNGSTILNFSVTADAASAAANRFMIVFRQLGVLPVTYSNVKAYHKNQAITVDWKVENERGILKYEVEKSTDGSHFNRINTTTATGNERSSNSYSILDENAANGNNFYRIKSIGNGGENKYSQVVKVIMGNTKSEITVYPNPIQNNIINLQFNNKPTGIYTLRLMNSTSGQIVYNAEISVSSGNTAQAISVQQQLAKGLYHLEVKGPGNTSMQQQVIVQ